MKLCKRINSRRRCLAANVASWILITTFVGFEFFPNDGSAAAFLVPTRCRRAWSCDLRRTIGAVPFGLQTRYMSTTAKIDNNSGGDDSVEDEDDHKLLKEVTRAQLVDFCSQHQLSTKGTKIQLLQRLRDFANEQSEKEEARIRERRRRVQQGHGNDSKERYETVSAGEGAGFLEEQEEDLDDDEACIYFSMPTTAEGNATMKNGNEHQDNGNKKPAKKRPAYTTNAMITAPPPPLEPNENGERVVTVYSTKEQNDLTGIAAAQPGAAMNDPMMMSSSPSSSSSSIASEATFQKSQQRSELASKGLEEAQEAVSELVRALLTFTGAPGFREEFTEGVVPLKDKAHGDRTPMSISSSPEGFVGFDPSKVPTDILIESSQALRAGRGEVLQDVLRDFEVQAIGHDGMAGDDIEKGGGHYREVSKVRAFLEGFRRAEVRRVARETTTMLLDRLVTDGVEGLDIALSTMTRSGDDTSDAGELNDSLLDFLNDAIRQQEKKVAQNPTIQEANDAGPRIDSSENDDPINNLWNVTEDEDGRVETIDPNDPRVKRALKEEARKYAEEESAVANMRNLSNKAAPEQTLILLKLLRERIKAEAAFPRDEKGHYLRILAYCLRLETDKERESLITKEFGASLDRLESFSELVGSSIEYGESTSHQLQPANAPILSVRLLKKIHNIVEEIRRNRSRNTSSGLKP